MGRYILRRILSTVVLLFGISIVIFFSVRLIPGDFATISLGTHYTEEAADALREQFGLNQPLVQQYFIWLKNVFVGDLGYSYMSNQPVIKLIMHRLPVTLELAGLSLLMAGVIGIPLGYIAGCKRNKAPDVVITSVGLFGISVPGFWLGSMMILTLSLVLGLFPSGGFVPISEGLWANLKCMVMPSIALGSAVSAVVMRTSRSSMIEVIDMDYILTARAKGLHGVGLITKHAVKNTLVNVITILGLQVGSLLGGSVVIEQIFSLQGVGSLALQAVNNRDYLLLQGTTLFIAVTFVVINLIVDLLYTAVNPQIRYQEI